MSRCPPSHLVNRNVTAIGGRTSLRLEPEIWDVFDAAAGHLGLTASELVQRIERVSPRQPRTSAVRVWVVTHLRERAEAAERAAENVLHRMVFDAANTAITTRGDAHDA